MIQGSQLRGDDVIKGSLDSLSTICAMHENKQIRPRKIGMNSTALELSTMSYTDSSDLKSYEMEIEMGPTKSA